jgi:hypothetical protein
VIQVERLKKPWRLWMWKSWVAIQPPSGASGHADQAGHDEAVRLAATDEVFGDRAGDDAEDDPGDDAHDDSEVR